MADYLEKKRSVFARFYFLSNDELLEILSQTKEVRNVRPHLRKVFEAIVNLEFKSDDTVLEMISAEWEQINFVKRIDPKDRNVEYWMINVKKWCVFLCEMWFISMFKKLLFLEFNGLVNTQECVFRMIVR